MATRDVILRWPGPAHATSGSSYVIKSDVATPGTFVAVSGSPQTATTPYASVSTTLTEAMTATQTSLIVASAASFANGDYAVIDKELMLLNGESGTTYTTVTRMLGGTRAAAHLLGVSMYKAHETKTLTAVDFGSGVTLRHVIRYRISHSLAGVEDTPAEYLAVWPSAPPTNNLATLWDVITDIQGNIKAGMTVQLRIDQTDDYHAGTPESLYSEIETTITDADGYFEFFIPRGIDHLGGAGFTLIVDPTGDANSKRERTITTVPNTDWVNFWSTQV